MVVFVTSIIFLFQVFHFTNKEGNTNPLMDSIFNMTIIMALIIIIFHNKDFSEAKDIFFRFFHYYFNCLNVNFILYNLSIFND